MLERTFNNAMENQLTVGLLDRGKVDPGIVQLFVNLVR